MTIKLDKRQFVKGTTAIGASLAMPSIGARAQAMALRWGDVARLRIHRRRLPCALPPRSRRRRLVASRSSRFRRASSAARART